MIRSALLAGMLLMVGCSKQPETVVLPAGEHAPRTPHGGMAVDLGDYNLEALVDSGKGTLEVYVLDDDLENFIRISQPQLSVTLNDKDASDSVVLNAVANPATGETVGSTSYFSGSSDWIRAHPHFQAVIDKVTIRASEFSHVAFTYPP